MKNTPLIGILVGIIVVLLIVVFSLGYQVSKWNNLYSKEKNERLETGEQMKTLSADLEKVKGELKAAKTDIEEKEQQLASAKETIQELNLKIRKLEKLKAQLENNLSDALLKQEKIGASKE